MKILSVENPIITIASPNSGPTIAVFAAIHGNETVGVTAINAFLESNNQINCGTVHFVLANIEAYEKNIRQCDVNLNRIFSRSTPREQQEEKRAHELMDILDGCDALLDIHAYNSESGTPFIIGSEDMKEYASYFPFEIFSYGWGELESGDTLEYMYEKGKSALCIECGSVFRPEKYLAMTLRSIEIFLAKHGILTKELQTFSQKKVVVYTVGHKKTDAFKFAKDYVEFEALTEGEVFATDDEVRYIAKQGEVILFPRPNKPIGGEVFLLGRYE